MSRDERNTIRRIAGRIADDNALRLLRLRRNRNENLRVTLVPHSEPQP